MNHVLTVEQTRAADIAAFKELGIPSPILMENAGRGCAFQIVNYFKLQPGEYVMVLCGSGNNGGDGAVIARWLKIMGMQVAIGLTDNRKGSPDTKLNLDICTAMEIEIHPLSEVLEVMPFMLQSASLVVDAIYGTGFKGKLPTRIAELIRLLNKSPVPACSVDIPSGVNADNGLSELCVMADLTVAMETFKPGHFLGEAKLYCGKLAIVPIGIPEELYTRKEHMRLLQDEDYEPPLRLPTAHKGYYGRLIIIGGCEGFTGASLLSAGAGLRAGAGYVYVYHRKEFASLYAARLTEALHVSVPEDKKGMPDVHLVHEMWKDAGAILIGPGLGTDAWALAMLKIVLEHTHIPTVLDADALNLISQNRILLPKLNRPNLVITPHFGEFCRLAAISIDALRADPIGCLKSWLPQSPMKILLKSHVSLFRAYQQVSIINTGNDGLATGGSGDVLAGIIASFLAQLEDSEDAAVKGAILLGKTANHLAGKRSPASIIPSDLIQNLMIFPERDE